MTDKIKAETEKSGTRILDMIVIIQAILFLTSTVCVFMGRTPLLLSMQVVALSSLITSIVLRNSVR